MSINEKVIKKVLIIGELFSDSLVENIMVTLKNMGYEVCVLPLNPFKNSTKLYSRILGSYLIRFFHCAEAYFSKNLERKTMEFQPDLVLSLEPGVSPVAIDKIKKETGAIVVCWYTDSIANLDRQYALAAPYDILFLKEPYMVELFRNKLNKNVYYLPEACNPIWHKIVDLNDEEKKYSGCDIAVTGNVYYYRVLILEQLMSYQLKIWGGAFSRWLESPLRGKFMARYVTCEEKSKAFGAAKINLNTLHPSEIYGVNCRIFEIAGCGGFQIVDYKPALKDIFEIDKEIVTFETIAELKEKVAYYLSHDDEREEIALRSYERAHKEHTYEQRLKTIMSLVSDDLNCKMQNANVKLPIPNSHMGVK